MNRIEGRGESDGSAEREGTKCMANVAGCPPSQCESRSWQQVSRSNVTAPGVHNIHHRRDRQGVMCRVGRVYGLKRANVWLSHNRRAVAPLEEVDPVEVRRGRGCVSPHPWRPGQHAGNHGTADKERKRRTDADSHQPADVFRIAVLDSHSRPPLAVAIGAGAGLSKSLTSPLGYQTHRRRIGESTADSGLSPEPNHSERRGKR
jgi:hypothetical protein